MKDKKPLAIAAVSTASILWGLSFLSIKVVVDVVPPMPLALLRFIVATATLYIFFKITKDESRLKKSDIPRVAAGGIFGVTLYYFFQNTGIKLISPSSASIIVASIPILSLIGESLIFKTKLTLTKILSVIISFIGVYIIVGLALKDSGGSPLGYLMMLGASLSWVIYMIITKPLLASYSQLSVIFYQYFFATIFVIPFSFHDKVQWSAVNTTIVLNIIFLGALCSALAYYLNAYAVDHLGVAVASVFVNLIPIATMGGSFFVLREHVSVNELLGGAIVIFSVFLANYEKKPYVNAEQAVSGDGEE